MIKRIDISPRCRRATPPDRAEEYAHLSWRSDGFPGCGLEGRAHRFCVSRGVAAAWQPGSNREPARRPASQPSSVRRKVSLSSPTAWRSTLARTSFSVRSSFSSRTRYAPEKRQLPSVSEPDTDRLCLLTHCAFGPFQRLRNLSYGRSRFGMSPKLPNIVFGPWISDGSSLLRHVH
jgi:hypothetical protein